MIHHWMGSLSARLFAIVFVLSWAAAGAYGQGEAQPPASGTKPSTATREQAPVGSAQKPAEQVVAPNQDQALYLVRATLLTLNDANRSGNYTVLRDLASPAFQAKNTAADLAVAFADLRRRNFDLFAVALLSPKFAAAPALDANGRLRLAGSFPSRPLQINFDLTFQAVNGQWRLLSISVATPPATSTQSQISAPERHSPKPFYGYRLYSGIVGLRW